MTFSYINPREQSFARRQAYFFEQHYFDIAQELQQPQPSSHVQTINAFDTLPESFDEGELMPALEDSLAAFEQDVEERMKQGVNAAERVAVARTLYQSCNELIEK